MNEIVKKRESFQKILSFLVMKNQKRYRSEEEAENGLSRFLDWAKEQAGSRVP